MTGEREGGEEKREEEEGEEARGERRREVTLGIPPLTHSAVRHR